MCNNSLGYPQRAYGALESAEWLVFIIVWPCMTLYLSCLQQVSFSKGDKRALWTTEPGLYFAYTFGCSVSFACNIKPHVQQAARRR